MKKKYIFSSILLITVMVIAIVIGVSSSSDYGVKFMLNNKTNTDIKNLKVSFEKNNISKISLPDIGPNKTESYTTDIANKDENVMVLEYLDSLKQLHKKTITYFENKPSNMRIDITIKSIDSNGVLEVDIKAKQ